MRGRSAGGAGLTAEQRRELEAMRAESRRPDVRAAEVAERAEIEAEIPPARVDPEIAKALGSIRAERTRRGLSLADVATRAEMSRIALSRLERGQGNPTLGTLSRVLSAMGGGLALAIVPASGPRPKPAVGRERRARKSPRG